MSHIQVDIDKKNTSTYFVGLLVGLGVLIANAGQLGKELQRLIKSSNNALLDMNPPRLSEK